MSHGQNVLPEMMLAAAKQTGAGSVADPGLPPSSTTALDQDVDQALHRLGDADAGAALVISGREAFALRVASARAAGRSLDLQYYAWHGDLTGKLLAHEALMAADRGVQVRMLLDDVFALGQERVLAALDGHPLIEVRIFNGTRWPAFGKLGFAMEMLLGGWHLNHRMHNKAWIADGCLAIAGGRNLGDQYFDAAEEFNFRDLDFVLAGTPARDAAAVFETYWRSPLARQAGEVSAARDAQGGLPTLRRNLGATAVTPAACAFHPLLPSPATLSDHLARSLFAIAADAIRIVADSPRKARRGLRARRLAKAAGGLGPEVAEALRKTQSDALLISPYFVPGEAGLALLVSLAERGVRVSIITNSLAATDVVAVHGGYARYRRRLLEAGIVLYELKPSGDETSSVFGSRGASLHTKAFVVDGRSVCVGSFNLDPRSTALNTEMGVFADHPALALGLQAEHERLATPSRSWRPWLAEGRMVWTDHDAQGQPRRQTSEPSASLPRRLLAALVRLLPIEAQL